MIITCPSCSARYPVDAASFTPAGRKVRCAKCAHTWHQAPPTDMPRPGGEDVGIARAQADAVETAREPAEEAEPEAEAQAGFVAPQKPLFRSEAAQLAKRRGQAADQTEAETETSGAAFAAPQAGAGGKLRNYLNDVASMRRGRVLGSIGWILLVLFVAGTIYGLVQYRKEIAAFWPSTTRLYAAAGAPINLLGLEFRNISYERQHENGLPVLAIKGSVVNISDEAKALPRLRVSLRDGKQQELYHWTFALAEKELQPKQAAAFTTRLSSPPIDARDIEVRFAQAGEEPEAPPAADAASAKTVPDAP